MEFYKFHNIYKLTCKLRLKRGCKIANQQIVNYIRQNRSSYSVENLKKFLVQKGYSKKDVDDAAAAVISEIPPPSMSPMNQTFQSMPQSQNSSGYSMACVAYLLTWLTGLIIYFTADKNDKYTRFHAMQSIFLGIAMTVAYYVFGIVLLRTFGLLFFIFGGFGLLGILWLAGIALIIFMMVSAYRGKKIKLPIIGNLAESIVEKS